MVGTVGYPNVGKSSVINVLCGKKLVGVANRPGKTKHFQTLNLSDDICLCDCPGLVFPSFANSKAEMMTCGVLHIDTIRDYAPPISLLMSRVPKEVIEKVYGIRMPPRNSPQYQVSILLSLVASKYGWLTGSGTPHEAKAARVVLRDYTNGKLLYCQVRPDYDESKHGPVDQSGFNYDLTQEAVADAHAYVALDSIEEEKEADETQITTTLAPV